MRELKCDGSGRRVIYRERGRSYLLCEVTEPHVHCYCGNPMPADKDPRTDHCSWCVLRENSERLHANASIRETADHLSGLSYVETQSGSSDFIGDISDEIHGEVVEEVFSG